MLEYEFLKKTIQDSASSEIKRMREYFSAYVRHVFGIGTQEHLAQINEYENIRQAELRQKHAIPNPYVVDELVRPIDNIWQAKGGDESYSFKGIDISDEFKIRLEDVRGGMSLKTFMKDIWFQRFISDPNGIIFLEVSKDGKTSELTYKSINKIHAYKSNGTTIKWIVFEPEETIIQGEEKVKIEYSWAVDEKNYYYCKNDGKTVYVEETKPHFFGMVPGVVNSSIFDTEKSIKISLIDKQISLLDSYLTKNSVKEIYQFKHNFAIPWSFPVLCSTCNGQRKTSSGEVCPSCHGSGFAISKDVSDINIIPKPEGDTTYPVPPMGYVQPSVETCDENRKELDWTFDKMFHSLWGTTVEKSDNETATGRFIDTMPVYNKLNHIADIVQSIHKQLIVILGKFYYPNTFIDAKVSYSRRYIIESPDVIWKRYQDARREKSPDMALNYMLEQFYYSEFASNQGMADYYIKLMNVEPYVHLTIDEVNSLNVTQNVKDSKVLFPEWQKTINEKDIEVKTVEQLKVMLDVYVQKYKVPEIPSNTLNQKQIDVQFNN